MSSTMTSLSQHCPDSREATFHAWSEKTNLSFVAKKRRRGLAKPRQGGGKSRSQILYKKADPHGHEFNSHMLKNNRFSLKVHICR